MDFPINPSSHGDDLNVNIKNKKELSFFKARQLVKLGE
jgi:hypothetical protein